MAIDTSFGQVRKFEDFLVTAVADMPEIDVQVVGSKSTDIVAGAEDGRLRLGVDNGDDEDVGAVTFGDLNWTAGGEGMKMEARIFLSSIADNKFFIGFGDTIATGDETSFSATTDTVTIDTMSDAIGILWDDDATTDVLWAVAGKTDNVTANKALSSVYNPVATEAITLGVYISGDRKSAVWYVNNKEVYRLDSDTTLIAAVDLVPGVWVYAQGTAFDLDVDYLYGSKGRATS